jgi:hypothetical protein
MKAVILALTIAGVASTATLNAQIVGTRLPTPSTSTTRGTTVNGSWQVVGRDRNGNTIYERRTYDGNGNIVIQRASRDVNGNFRILNTRTVRNDNNRDCQVVGSNGSVGDIIFGRNGTTDCRNDRGDRRAVDGVWRQVGQGRNNNSVYERRTLDANGNVVVQKGRRNSNGTFTILSTRTIRNNGARNRNGNDDDRFDRRRGDHDDDDDRFDRRRDNDDDDRFSRSEQNGRGRGKGHKGRD